MGIGFVVEGGYGGGPCAPSTPGPGPGPGGVACPTPPNEPPDLVVRVGDVSGSSHYWLNPCSNYAYSNYSTHGIGCDRTQSGTGYTGQYKGMLAKALNDPVTCPEELLLFFHNLPWDWSHPNWKAQTLIARIRRQHVEALAGARSMAAAWDSLQRKVTDGEMFAAVQARFAQQLNDAAVFSKVMLDYYGSLAGGE